MSRSSSRTLSESDKRVLRSLLSRYAARYFLSGPDKDDLVEQTFHAMAAHPQIFFQKPVEQAVAETMHRIYQDSIATRIEHTSKNEN